MRMQRYSIRRLLTVVLAIFTSIWVLIYVSGISLQSGFLRDAHTYVVGRDFMNGWMMGKAGLEEEAPEKNYDYKLHTAKLRAVVNDPEYIPQQWSYPPSYMLLMAPFAMLPYGAAWAIFMTLSVVALFVAVKYGACRGDKKQIFVLLIASPAALISAISGQLSMLVAAAQIVIFELLDRRPVLAGVLLGLLSVKPQVGIVYPFFLIATRRWRVFLAAACTVLAILMLTAVIWGAEVWRVYMDVGVPAQHTLLEDPPKLIACLIPTIFMDLWFIGASYDQAFAVQMLVAIVVISSFFLYPFRTADRETQMLILAAGGVLVTPYLMAYDLLFFTYAVIVYMHRQQRISIMQGALVIGCYGLPLLHLFLGVFSVPGSALLPAAFIWLVTKEKPTPT